MGGRESSCLHEGRGSAAYSRHVGEDVQLLTVGIYMEQEAQLFIVGPWGQGIIVWVHGNRV